MILRINGVTKHYGAQIALDQVTLTLQGGVVAILGANGSGKSTLLKILATLLKSDVGEIQFDALNYSQHQRELRAQIGYLPQDMEFPELLTPRKLFAHLATLRGGNIAQVIAQFQLEPIIDREFHQLSSGQIRLVGIAQTVLGSPRLLLLDELTRGLDVTQRGRVFRRLQADNRLMLFSTHIPNEVEWGGAQTVIILHQGKILYCGAVEKLLELAKGSVYEVDIPTEKQHLYDAHIITQRITLNHSQMRLRLIGHPPHDKITAVLPTLEDAYLFVKNQPR